MRFSVLFVLYLSVVFAWTLWVYPLGRDYAVMNNPGAFPWPVSSLLIGEINTFGAWLPGYHLVNLLLMYGCMIGLFALTRLVIAGPVWLGSLVAVLTMANPLKSEVMLNITGSTDLLPALLCIWCFVCYGLYARKKYKLAYGLCIALLYLVSTQFTNYAGAFLVLVLFEAVLLPRYERRWSRLGVVLGVGIYAVTQHWGNITGSCPELTERLMPLFLIVYPIGLMPDNVQTLATSPWMMYGLTLITGLVVIGICLLSKSRMVFFAVLAAVGFRIMQGGAPIDLVHMIGGGQMIISIGLMSLGFTALCYRIMQHPKWLKPVVTWTTFLCLLLFIIQGRYNLSWYQAGREVKAFQAEVSGAYTEQPRLLFPNVRYVQGAPLDLKAAIAVATPFSQPIPCRAPETVSFWSWDQVDQAVVSIEEDYYGLSGPVPRTYVEGPKEERFRPLVWRRLASSDNEV